MVIDDELTQAARCVDRIRNNLIAIDSDVISANARLRDRAAEAKASSYVFLAACLEQFFVNVVMKLVLHLNELGLENAALRPSLGAMLCHNELKALSNVRGLKAWQKRVTAFEKANSNAQAEFSTENIPYDGRTVRSCHFTLVWVVFGFKGEPVPSGRHGFALTDLAEGRNALAHGRVDPLTFGRTKQIGDVRRLLDLVDDVLLHLGDAVESYIERQGYFA